MSTMIEDLLHPTAFPERPKEITLAQTHISTVFIGDKYVYKIKKPVNFGFLDFSTVEKRKHFCTKEVELNNRFSDGIYLGVYPVTYDGTSYAIDGKGDIVDYAVKMKRLSDDDLLKTRLKQGKVTADDISRIGKAIATFHQHSEQSSEISTYGTIASVRFNTDENFEQTQDFIGHSITKEQFDELKAWTDTFYQNHAAVFTKRITEGHIRDCHGDLHMEHICLADPIIIFDCIEFNDRFRYSDTLSDIAFLLMDLQYNGADDIATQLLHVYLPAAGEQDTEQIHQLITFYKVYRAYVRGKVTSFILHDDGIDEQTKQNAQQTAQRYFALAHSYITQS